MIAVGAVLPWLELAVIDPATAGTFADEPDAAEAEMVRRVRWA